jgi:hypothetical protein
VRAPAQNDCVAREPSEFGQPQPCLDREQQHSVISTPNPSCSVGCCEQRLDLKVRQEMDQSLVVSLAGYREYALDKSTVRRLFESDESKEGTDGG